MSFKVGILTALLIASLWFVINVSKGEKQLCVVKKMFLVGSLYDLVFLGDQNSLSELRVGDCDWESNSETGIFFSIPFIDLVDFVPYNKWWIIILW